MGQSTKKNLLIAAAYALVLITGMLLGPKFEKENSDLKNGAFLPFGMSSRHDKMGQLMQIIQNNYVDSVNLDTLQHKAIEGIIKQLDPHTIYLSPAEVRMLSEDLEGNFNGIGIEYYILNDTVLVTAVNNNGPAYEAGVLPGDQILKINNKSIAGTHVTGKMVVEQIRGPRGTSMMLSLKRGPQMKQVKVVRNKITISSIDAAYLLNKGTGYIKISRFGDQTDEDFLAALERLQNQGMKNLVLDLRQNGGGYLSSATALASQFLKEKSLIVYTQGLHEPRTDYFSTGKGQFEKGQLVVLIDENSASASEIIAGAVQDLDRGIIIGRRSFGKGLVQQQFNFGDGSALNLTIARYYTPSGRSIQKPYQNGAEAYYQEVAQRLKNGELSSDGNISDTLFNKQHTYLTRSGKVVYGGGGIMPDIYIPIDTSGLTNYYTSVSRKGIVNEFVFRHLINFNAKPSQPEVFLQNFTISKSQYDELVKLAAARNITSNGQQIQLSKKAIENDAKALLVRYYFGDEAFYKLLNNNDQAIARSLEVFK
ncbi:MAG TPA: S41 family peptidase [Daejeonella sp.]|nr:S41 family peptidase [Daejeonella sp.]